MYTLKHLGKTRIKKVFFSGRPKNWEKRKKNAKIRFRLLLDFFSNVRTFQRQLSSKSFFMCVFPCLLVSINIYIHTYMHNVVNSVKKKYKKHVRLYLSNYFLLTLHFILKFNDCEQNLWSRKTICLFT